MKNKLLIITSLILLPISLKSAELAEAKDKEEVDLTIGLMSGLPSHYTCRRVKNVSYIFCATPKYLKKFGEQI